MSKEKRPAGCSKRHSLGQGSHDLLASAEDNQALGEVGFNFNSNDGGENSCIVKRPSLSVITEEDQLEEPGSEMTVDGAKPLAAHTADTSSINQSAQPMQGLADGGLSDDSMGTGFTKSQIGGGIMFGPMYVYAW